MLTGLRIGLILAFLSILGTETIASFSGLGHRIVELGENMDTAAMFAYIIFVVLISIVLNAAVSFAKRLGRRGTRETRCDFFMARQLKKILRGWLVCRVIVFSWRFGRSARRKFGDPLFISPPSRGAGRDDFIWRATRKSLRRLASLAGSLSSLSRFRS